MYDKLISKNINHFGKDGVIMYSKHCDYYDINPITIEDIKMFYDFLKSKETLPRNVLRLPQFSCCLYYLSKNEPRYINIFTQYLIQKLSKKDEENDTNLFLIYNIIEFDQRYLHSTGQKTIFLLDYLEKFTSTKKTLENFLLFKYYRGLLKYHLGQINDAYTEYMEIIIASEDYAKDKTKYIEFIRLKNDLLKIQLDLTKHIREEYFEQYCFTKELFDKVKIENKKLAVKLGFCLYTILCRQNKFNECIPLLMEMKKILKKETLSGIKMKVSIDYYLAIASRIGYIGILIGNKNAIEYTIKKLKKILDIIERDKQDKKLFSIYNTYAFIISILNIYLGNFENKLKEKGDIVKAEFFTNNIELKNDIFLINDNNKEDLIINLNAINNMDYNLNTIATKIIDSYKYYVNSNKKLTSNKCLTFMVGMHDIISRLSESYCTDYNKNKRNDYINEINKHTQIVYNYAKINKDEEPYIETDLVKNLLINIHSSCVHANIISKNMDMAKKLILFFDNLSKGLNIKEENTSFELVYKAKGDYWFKNGDYKGAITYYQSAINKMKNNDPKKPVIFFNLGCSFYFINDNKHSIEYLNECINAFRSFEYEKKTFNVLNRQDVIIKKINIAKNILKNIEVFKK